MLFQKKIRSSSFVGIAWAFVLLVGLSVWAILPTSVPPQAVHRRKIMSTSESTGGDGGAPPPAEFTTNAKDQEEAAKLVQRLQQQGKPTTTASGTTDDIPSVQMDDGAHKYVQITAQPASGSRRTFVVSRRGAAYHRNAAEPFVDRLQRQGYTQIRVEGGGRIMLDEDAKKVSIFGYSYSFGQANHAISQQLIEQDPRFQGYHITWSNEGY